MDSEVYFKNFYGIVNNNEDIIETTLTLEEFDKPITLEELQLSLNKCRSGKTSGQDYIPYEFYKALTPPWEHYLLNFYKKY